MGFLLFAPLQMSLYLKGILFIQVVQQQKHVAMSLTLIGSYKHTLYESYNLILRTEV